VGSTGVQGDDTSGLYGVSVSADGRFVAFQSYATNLIPGDTNGNPDIFLRDRQTGLTTLVSVDSSGVHGNDASFYPAISSDGRFLAFRSYASNLVSGDTNGVPDIFVHDRISGTTTRVSVDSAGGQSNASSNVPSISSDGRYVAFESSATNLVAGDANGVEDVFVHDLQTGATIRVSVDSGGSEGDGASGYNSISGDGRYVAFISAATNLVPGDTNGFLDVFVHDLQSGSTTRASVDASGFQGDADSLRATISSNGRCVAFHSLADNLVPGDTNGIPDVFVRDLQAGTTTRVSVSSSGAQASGNSLNPSISYDGRFVAFESLATDLVSGDTNARMDVFLRDRLLGATTRVSVDSGGNQANDASQTSSISLDGRYVAFRSTATNLVGGDTNGFDDVFVRERGAASAILSFCPGDGTGSNCPCGNIGASGHGCENSSSTGGALLSATGTASLSTDSVQCTSSGERPTALSVLLQGSTAVAPGIYGDGLRCAGGVLKRLYVKSAMAGVVTVPQAGDLSISAESAAKGDPLSLGATRVYQVYYRDPSSSFCPNPPGGTFNVSNAIAIAWGA
jgi:Tol biopolymer transport system component